MKKARKVTLGKKVQPVNNTAKPKEPRWLDFYDLIFGERHITTGQLADAIENTPFRGWDEYGRFRQFNPKPNDKQSDKAAQHALRYIADVWKWRIETSTEEFGEDDPTGTIPPAGFGWYENELPPFGQVAPQPQHGAAGGTQKGENYTLNIVGALIDLWTGHASGPAEKTKNALIEWLTSADCDWHLTSDKSIQDRLTKVQKLLQGRTLFPADRPFIK